MAGIIRGKSIKVEDSEKDAIEDCTANERKEGGFSETFIDDDHKVQISVETN